MQYSVSLLHEILTVIAWVIMLLLGYREMRKYDKLYEEYNYETEEEYFFYKPRSFWYRMLIFTMLFVTFGCVGGDFLHNQVIYDLNVQSDHPIHFEDVYVLLIKGLPTNYYLWRFCVWGLAAFLLFMILDEIKSDLDFSFFVFTLMLMNYFPNLRQTLGFMMMFYGYVLLFHSAEDAMPQKLVMGIILLIISTFFHSTIFVFIVLSLLLFIPGTKSLAMIIVSVLLFPYLYDITKELSTQFIGMVSNNDAMQEKATKYIESSFRVELNIRGFLKIIVNRLPVLMLFFYGIKKIFIEKVEASYMEKHLLMLTYLLIYISCLFFNNNVSAYLSQRFWDAACYPLTIFAMIFLRNYSGSLYVRITLYAFLVSNIFNMAYSLYTIDNFNANANSF
ncbi:MAG: EpsG family protein [Bacteroidaceae bacterium]|nr:EpsG family protein [Bacteroidaceae bacterium]